MKIFNHTKWDTKDLRAICQRALANNVKFEGPFASKRLKVTFKTAKYYNYSGWAYVNSGIMHINLPAPKDPITGVPRDLNTFKTAHVFEHELMHCRGIRGHKNMGAAYTDWDRATQEHYAYAKDLVVRVAELKPAAPKTDLQIVRYQRVLAKFSKWQGKRKNAATLEQKYKAQVLYYEKELAKDGRLAALKGRK